MVAAVAPWRVAGVCQPKCLLFFLLQQPHATWVGYHLFTAGSSSKDLGFFNSSRPPVLHYPTVLGKGDELCFMPLAADHNSVILFSSSPVEPQS